MNTLDKARLGRKVIVENITSCELWPKLMDMGLYPGKEVCVMYKAPLGDPLAVDVGGYVLSLRKDEAGLILVK